MNNEELDNTLRQWAAAKKPAPEHMDMLIRRIGQETRRKRHEERFAEIWNEPVSIWYKLSYAGLGAVAAAAVCLVILRAPTPAVRPAIGQADIACLAGISSQQLQSNTQLFSEMKRLFSDGLRWIAQSDGEVGIGMETRPNEVAAASAPMLVKVAVLSRKTGDTAWRQAWNADMILHGQDMVEVVPDRRSNNKLTLWVYPLDDGKLAVDTSVSLRIPVTVASRLNTIVTPGQPVEIASLTLEDTEYRVFQTVEIIKRSV